MKVAMTLNGQPVEAEIPPRTNLADFVREHQHLTATHVGCEHGVCGACTVVINGETARSCITYAVACDGADVRTLEAYESDPLMARLRQAFKEEHALQCGYCTPGMLMAARDLIRRQGGLDTHQIRVAMSGNLCRCTGYVGIVRAIERVMAERAGLLAMVEPAARHLGSLPPEAGQRAQPMEIRSPARVVEPESSPPLSGRDLDPFDETSATRIEEHLRIAFPRPQVWALLADVEQMAACLPGATLYDRDGAGVREDAEPLAGVMRVKLGPMAVAFAGQARLTRSEANWSGMLDGQGAAKASGSRVRGRMSYRLLEDGPAATRIDVAMAYRMTGPLAQFSRGTLVHDVVRQIARAFASNIETRLGEIEAASARSVTGDPLAPPRPKPAAELKAGSLLWSVLWSRLKALWTRAR